MNKLKNDEVRWSSLMISAQNGNEDSYRQLLQELGDAIAHYLQSRFGHFDALEDCVQESLIAVHKARNTYESHRLFRPWLFAIVRHKTIDLLRKKDTYQKKVATLEKDELEFKKEYSSRIADADLSIEAGIDCNQILSALSDKHREAIVLTKLQGLSIREAAEQINISESAMKVRVHRALDASRQLLESEFY